MRSPASRGEGGLQAAVRRTLAWFPRGQSLPDAVWLRRHHGLQLLLWAHVPALFAFALTRGVGVPHALLEMVPIVTCALLARVPQLGRRGQAAAVAIGLLSCSAILVHLWDGTIEAHFHYFVMVVALAAYEEWFPYLLAFGYVVLQHGLMGMMEPGSVYAHGDEDERSPWTWAAIHGGFIAALGIASMATWRANEDVRAELEHQATHDPLTGLPNRTLLTRKLQVALDRGAAQGTDVAAVFVDLDDFKVINDSLGHDAGDRLLVAAAGRLREVLRPDDVIARFGGDELAVCLDPVVDAAEAARIVDRLAAALRAPFVLDGEQRFVTASFGIAVAHPDQLDRTPESLLRDADAAMYRAKERGKARTELFDTAMRRRAVERLELESGLHDALEREQLRVVYQPEVSLQDGSIVAVEALLRWEHPQHGTVSPARFVPIAEQSGLIVPIGAWVLREACRQAALWEQPGDGPGVIVAVNLSPRQLGAPDLEQTVHDALDASGLAPERLCLEITESAVMADPQAAIAKLHVLKRLGVKLAIDDFGVGYSSLSHLRELLPVDVLKIDRSFIDGVTRRGEDRAIVTAIVELARALGVDAVAEGVETPEQAAVLRTMRCQIGQGFHFARPQAPRELAQLLDVHQLGELLG